MGSGGSRGAFGGVGGPVAPFRDRIVLLAKVVLAFEAAALVLRLTLLPLLGRADELAAAPTWLTLMALSSMALAWIVLARLELADDRARLAADLAVLWAVALPAGGLVAAEDPSNAGAASAASGLGIFLVLRGALVATDGRRTALVAGSAAAIAAACFAAVAWSRGTFYPDALLRLVVALALFVGLAVVCSRIVYGLRRQVEEARTFGQYVIEEELGRGGMGVVYKAHHVLMARPTAVKVLPTHTMDPEGVARFRREVEVMAQLRHPNTVAVYDFGRAADGSFYYAMELVDGMNLHELVVRHGVMPPGRVVYVLDQVLGSLGEAHGHGLVHRDVKPGNVLLSRAGGEPDVAKVLDFGLAKDFAAAAHLTIAGQLLGTPLYMAPEAMQGASHAVAASDLYGVAAIGYFLLTGTHPFQAKSKRDLLRLVREEPPEPPSLRRGDPVPIDLERALLRGLAKEPGARFEDAERFRRVLRQCDVAPWTREDALAWWEAVQPSGARRPARPDAATTRRELRLDLSSRVDAAAPAPAATGRAAGEPSAVP